MSADIVFCADSRFALGAWVALWSAWRHWQGDEPPHFHLLTSDVQCPGIRKIQRLAWSQQIPLTIHSAGLDAVKNLPDARHSALKYLRLLAPEMLSGLRRFLYLDADVLVRVSLHPLLDELPSSAVLAAARDFGLHSVREGIPYLRAAEHGAAYFNSGVLAVNCETWKKERITERALEFLSRHAANLLCRDQEGLNGVLLGHFHLLDPTWNVQLGAIDFFDRTGWPADRQYLKARRDELLSSPKIVHFVGAAKPWNDGLRMLYGGEYRSAIFDSRWIDRKWEAGWKLQWLAGAVRRAVKRRLGSK